MFMWEIFESKVTPFSQELEILTPYTQPPTTNRLFGLEGLLFRVSLTWNNLLHHIKGLKTLPNFKSVIKYKKYKV